MLNVIFLKQNVVYVSFLFKVCLVFQAFKLHWIGVLIINHQRSQEPCTSIAQPSELATIACKPITIPETSRPGPWWLTAGSQPHSELGTGVTILEVRKQIVQVHTANKWQKVKMQPQGCLGKPLKNRKQRIENL